MNINKFTEDNDARHATYDEFGGGNGCAMRNMVIGMCLFGEHNIDKLIDVSITTSRLTHNNPIGYLGGFGISLFAALAIEKIDLYKWPYMLISLLKSNKVKKVLTIDNLDEVGDYNKFIKYWEKYIDTRFKNGIPIKTKSHMNPMFRIRYYFENFVDTSKEYQIGTSGISALIIAYDTLIDCENNWEKLIVYSILHQGDSDTIGAIAGGLYGLLYGYGDVPLKLCENIEEKNTLLNLSDKIFKKFYLSE